MKRKAMIFVLAAAVATLVALLLAGCQEYRIETNTMDGITI